jgi:hypothetical protein
MAEWSLAYEMLDGDVSSGPMPTLFPRQARDGQGGSRKRPREGVPGPGKDPPRTRHTREHPAFRGLNHRAETEVDMTCTVTEYKKNRKI